MGGLRGTYDPIEKHSKTAGWNPTIWQSFYLDVI